MGESLEVKIQKLNEEIKEINTKKKEAAAKREADLANALLDTNDNWSDVDENEIDTWVKKPKTRFSGYLSKINISDEKERDNQIQSKLDEIATLQRELDKNKYLW